MLSLRSEVASASALITVASIPMWSPSHTIAALGGNGDAAEDVAAADDDADFHTHLPRFGYVSCNAVCDRYINSKSLAAHEGFAGSLE